MWKPKSFSVEKEKMFMASGHTQLVARLLAQNQRNINPDTISKFLNSNYEDLSAPNLLGGTKEAAAMFCQAAKNKEHIAVIGDYDCDGILSSVMIKELCNIFKLDCTVFLPSRVEHGYGLNVKTLASFKDRVKGKIPDLLFILDCGSNNEEEVKNLKAFGIKKVIIIDHHIIDTDKESKSADVFINWHKGSFPETCACGEVFHLIRSIRWLTKKVNPMEFLTYAAIGVLADVSPITEDNRIIVRHGLSTNALSHIVASGCNALIKDSRIYSSISQEDVLFKIAPRINAVGRLHKPDVAFHLLIENDLATAELMAASVTEFNDKRKALQKKMEKEAVRTVQLDLPKYEHGIVLYNPEWSVGVVGIVASKIVDAFHKPTLVISKNGDTIKGSGRSLGHINLKEVLDICKDMFTGYGGHAMAAGVTVKSDCLDKVNAAFNAACKKYYEEHGYPSEVSYYDAAIMPKAVSMENSVKLLQTLYPYCQQNNPEPVFALKNVTIGEVKASSGEKLGNEWHSLSFVAEKNGETTPLRLRMFADEFGTEIEGRKADVYISLPQAVVNNKYPAQANVIELVLQN